VILELVKLMEVIPPESEVVLGNETKPWREWCRLALEKIVQIVTSHVLHFSHLKATEIYIYIYVYRYIKFILFRGSVAQISSRLNSSTSHS
jgi:hypothetical protein